MNNKFWLLIAGILSIAILAMGWFLGVSPKLDELTAANDQRVNVEQQNRQHEAKLKHLKKQFAQLDKLKAKLAEAQLGLPPGDELSTFLGQLHLLEKASGVSLTKFTAGDGQRYLAAPGAVVNSAVTANNFVAITIDLTVSGSRAQVINFVNDLQYGNRLFLVNKLVVTQSPSGSGSGSDSGSGSGSGSDAEGESDSYQGSITGYVYVLVDPSAPPPTSTPVGSLDTKEPSPSPSP